MTDRRSHIPKLAVRRVDVDKMYGHRFGMSLTDLSDGINIVAGRNAVGKTTLARAIRCALWPKQEDREEWSPFITLAADLDSKHYDLQVQSGEKIARVDGERQNYPALDDGLDSSLYFITLKELLTDDDKNLAAQILRQASGGIDVGIAADKLEFKESGARKNEITERVVSAKEALQAAKNEASALFNERSKLEDLERQLDDATKASEDAEAFSRAIVWKETRRQLREAEEKLARYPEAVSRLHGNEAGEIESLTERLQLAERKRDAAENEMQSIEESIRDSSLPDEVVESLDVRQMKSWVDDLDRVEGSIEEIERRLTGVRAQAENAWSHIAGAIDPEKAGQTSSDTPGVIRRFADADADARGRSMAVDAIRSVVSDDKVASPEADRPSLDQLKRARESLVAWLTASADAGSARISPLFVLAIILLVAGAIAVGILVHTIGYAFLAVAAILLIHFVQSRNSGESGTGTSRHTLQEKYEATDVRPPREWNPVHVDARLTEVLDAIVDAETRTRIRERLDTILRRERDELESYEQVRETARIELRDMIGIDPGEFGGEPFKQLIDGLIAWRRYDNEQRGIEAERDTAEKQREELLDHVNGLLSGLERGPVESAAAARSESDWIDEEIQRLKSNQAQLTTLRVRVDEARDKIELCENQIGEIYSKLDLEVGDKRSLDALVAEREEWERARHDCTQAETRFQDADRALEESGLATDEIESKSVQELESEREKAAARASERDSIIKAITRIENDIRRAENETEIEDADADLSNAVEDARRERMDDYRKNVGAVLARFVTDQSRERELPEVFRRAREIFSNVTHERYILQVRDGSFRAEDTMQAAMMTLEQLSSGTRAQLLLSVRLAFIELHERVARLPLILDETLAHSDAERADAIIETVAASARDRQVFYLTAQHDEVVKWIDQLDEGTYRTFELPAGTPQTFDLESVPVQFGEIPKPYGVSYDEYRDLLEVPAWTGHDPLGSLHLWYLFDDPKTLYELLRRGYERFGPFREKIERSGESAFDLPRRDIDVALVRAEIVSEWQRGWKIGRGKRVDRAVLEESGAVSNAYIDEVSELCERVGGDGGAIVRGLDEGEIKGFRSSKTEELREFLRERGFVVEESPLSDAAIRRRIVHAVEGTLRDLDLDISDIDGVLDRFTW